MHNHIDDTGGHLRISHAVGQLHDMKSLARTAAITLAILGVLITVATGGLLGDIRAAYGAGLILIVLAGHMVIAWGAARGHLTLYRLIETRFAELNGRLDAELNDRLAAIARHEERNSEVIGDLLADELRRRR